MCMSVRAYARACVCVRDACVHVCLRAWSLFMKGRHDEHDNIVTCVSEWLLYLNVKHIHH